MKTKFQDLANKLKERAHAIKANYSAERPFTAECAAAAFENCAAEIEFLLEEPKPEMKCHET